VIAAYIEKINERYVTLSIEPTLREQPRSHSAASGLCWKDRPMRLLRPQRQMSLLPSLAIKERRS
jgi:hypothetical protein